MAKKFVKGWISTPIERYLPNYSDKAIALTYDNEKVVWFPRSCLKISEPNDVGNVQVSGPMWLIKSKGIDYHKIVEIDFKCD